jgi:hypothetical protein
VIFASKTPRDLNHDREPYVDGHLDTAGFGRRFSEPYSTPDHCQACGTRYDPRPEFDHVQHNPPNPILVWLRAIWDDPKCGTHAEIVDYMLNDPRMIDPRMHEHTPARIDHARRVLTRLARLTEGAST